MKPQTMQLRGKKQVKKPAIIKVKKLMNNRVEGFLSIVRM